MHIQRREENLGVAAEAVPQASNWARAPLKRSDKGPRYLRAGQPLTSHGLTLSLTPKFSRVQKACWATHNCFDSLAAKRSVPLAVLLFSLVMFTGNSFAGVKTGELFPDLTTFKLEGKLPETTKAKVIMVDFWASWCEPCKQSFPVMEELQQRYGKEGLVIIAVNVDENRADMEAFLKKNAVTFAVIRDPNQKLVERTGVATMPSSFLIDREGKVRFLHNGYRGAETKKKYDEEIQGLLK